MRFAGQLQVPHDPDPGLRVVLELSDHFVTITSGADQLGAWPLDEVTVLYVDPDRFSMTVGGDTTLFLPDDPVRFAYEGLVVFERAHAATGTLGRLWTWLTEPEQRPDELPEAFEISRPTLTLVREDPPEELLLDLGSESDEPPSTSTCAGRRKDGMPCRSQILRSSGFCAAHDPDYQPGPRRRTRRWRRDLEQIIDAVAAGEMDPVTASAIAELVQAVCALDRQAQQTQPSDWGLLR